MNKLSLPFLGFALLLFLFSHDKTIAQESVELPNLSPQSPEAFQFTKYGEVNVNESTGTINPSIPLYNYRAGDIDIPIALNYSGNGVKVAQDPTWVGINWNLTPGGVITRQVRDIPDEKASGKKFFTLSQMDALPGAWGYTNTSTQWYTELSSIASTTNEIDSEVDIFNYNFLGYSGSFYLDETLQVHLIRYDKELDIEFQYVSTDNVNNDAQILIKTPEGDTYWFGGPDASESSKTVANNGAGSGVGIDFAQNAFYLNNISFYNGGNVTFDYDKINLEGTSFLIDKTESLSKFIYAEANACNSGNGGYNYKETDLNLVIQSKIFLSEITSSFNSSSIEFSYSSLGLRKRKLNSVEVKDVNNNPLKKFTFEYLTVDSGDGYDNRFFLEKVNFLDKNLNKIHDYQLEYNSPNLLPDKWSKARDHNGYFNGKSNNTLLPIHSAFTGTITLANRDTDAVKIQYGSLKKITYPTGGYTTFEYEVPIRDYTTVIGEENMQVYYNDPTRNGDSQYDDTLWYNTDDTFSLTAQQVIDVDLNAVVTGDLTHHNKIVLTAVKLGSGNNTSVELLNMENANNTTITTNTTIPVTILETGEYYFKLELVLYPTPDLTVEVSSNVTLNIATSQQVPEFYPLLRIKRVNTYSSNQASPIVRRYYYNEKDNLNKESLYLVKDPQYVYETRQIVTCGVQYDELVYLNLSVSALNNIFLDDSGKTIYPFVTTSYGGDNFENGGKESKFYAYGEGRPLAYFPGDINSSYGNNLSYANSTMLYEEFFKPDLTVLKRIDYEYSVLPNTHIMHNIKPQRISNNLGIQDIRKNNFGFYDISSRKYVLNKVTTTDNSLENSANPVITEQFYEYENYVDRYSSVKIKDSKGLDVETKSFYSLDVISEDEDLTTSEKNLILNLDSQNRIYQPYMVKQYFNGNLRSATQTVFSDEWTTNKIWPKKIKTAKVHDSMGNNYEYEDRIDYKDYSTYGKLEEVSLSDGTSTKYLYNSNQQMVLKIENYVQGELDDGIPISSPCYFQETYYNAMVTVYEYDPNNDNLISTQDSKCVTTFFEYDEFNRLKQMKDEDGNIVSENNYHYKNQQ